MEVWALTNQWCFIEAAPVESKQGTLTMLPKVVQYTFGPLKKKKKIFFGYPAHAHSLQKILPSSLNQLLLTTFIYHYNKTRYFIG